VKKYFIEVSDGVKLNVIDFTPEGSDPTKPVVVFVAGWISLPSGWKDFLKTLTPRYRTLYVETREKISSILPKGRQIDFSIERMALDIGEILQKTIPDGETFYFAGSSMGATIILDYLSLGKRQPTQSFLISPIAKFSIPTWALGLIKLSHPSFYSAIKPVVKWYLKNFRLDKKREPEQVAKYEGTLDAAEPARLKINALSVSKYSLWDKLGRVKSPVCLIGARTDTLHGVEELEKMVALMPHATLILMQSNKETHSERAGSFIADRIAGSG